MRRDLHSSCRCHWHAAADMPLAVPIMTNRDRECPQHGDDTDWWTNVQARAAALMAAESGSNPGGSDG